MTEPLPFDQPFPEFDITLKALSGDCGSIPPDCTASGTAVGYEVNYQVSQDVDDGWFNYINSSCDQGQVTIGSGGYSS